MEQDFHGNFQVNVILFFAFFYGVLVRIVFMLDGLKVLFTLLKLANKVVLDH